jgi:hypothetical protein
MRLDCEHMDSSVRWRWRWKRCGGPSEIENGRRSQVFANRLTSKSRSQLGERQDDAKKSNSIGGSICSFVICKYPVVETDSLIKCFALTSWSPSSLVESRELLLFFITPTPFECNRHTTMSSSSSTLICSDLVPTALSQSPPPT